MKSPWRHANPTKTHVPWADFGCNSVTLTTPEITPMPAASASSRSSSDAAEKNRPLVEDIRLLGRILGDVIREQEGKDAFELIERVRQLSVAYRLKRDAHAGRALD